MTAPISDAVPDLPPSAKTVFITLYYEGEMSQGDLAEATALPKRTVRYAVNRLSEEDAIEDETDYQDARKRVYSLVDRYAHDDHTPTNTF